MILNEELQQLKKLQRDLRDIETAKAKITIAEGQVDAYKKECFRQNPIPSRLAINNAELYKGRTLKNKKDDASARFSTASKIVIAVAVVAVLALLAVFLFKFDYIGNEYLYTPEIVKTYTRICDKYNFATETLKITSCSETGEVKATLKKYEYSKYDEGLIDEFEMVGKVISKTADNKLVKVHFDFQSHNDLSGKTLIFCDDFNTIKYKDFCLFAIDTVSTESLSAPRIVGTYNSLSLGYYRDVKITSCDANGVIKGEYIIDSSSDYGKCAISGEVTKINEDGSVDCTLNIGNWIDKSWAIKPDKMEVKFLPNNHAMFYKGVVYTKSPFETIDDLAGKYWVSAEEFKALESGEFIKRRPLSEQEQALKDTMSKGFYMIPLLAIVLLIILKIALSKNKLSADEQKEYERLQAVDNANRKENESYTARVKKVEDEIFEKVSKYRGELLADYNSEIRLLEKEVAQNNVLGPKDKYLGLVDYVIDIIENRRADSVKEALKAYDNYQAGLLDQFNKRQDEIVRKYKAQEEAEEYLNQKIHRMKLEREAQKQTEELEKIRKELEDR